MIKNKYAKEMKSRSSNEYGYPETPHQLPVRKLLVKGLSNKEIAEQLGLSLSCVKFHVGNILKSWKLKSRAKLIAKVKGLS